MLIAQNGNKAFLALYYDKGKNNKFMKFTEIIIKLKIHYFNLLLSTYYVQVRNC